MSSQNSTNSFSDVATTITTDMESDISQTLGIEVAGVLVFWALANYFMYKKITLGPSLISFLINKFKKDYLSEGKYLTVKVHPRAYWSIFIITNSIFVILFLRSIINYAAFS